MRRVSLLVIALVLAVASVLRAQGTDREALARALDLERQGKLEEAAAGYRTLLDVNSGDQAALLGLERVLDPLGRQAEILAAARRAAATEPGPAAFGVLIRAWVFAGQQDSARTVVLRWSRESSGDLAPWRDWVQASIRRRDRAAARAAVELARQSLGRPNALAYEMAQLRAAESDWGAAAGEWLKAIADLPGYQLAAAAALAPAPEGARPAIRSTLAADSSLDARLLAAVLDARWGAPEQAAQALIRSLPDHDPAAVEALTMFTSQLQGVTSRPAMLARGAAFEEIARRSVGTAASRARVDAARAYQAGGDTDAARRVLARMSESGPAGGGASAMSTLVSVLIDAGRLPEAEAKFATVANHLSADERSDLTRALAWGWARQGDLARAEARLSGDSTVDGLALRGRIAIFRGEVKNGSEMLRKAGPYAGSRQAATERTALLALLQPIEQDSLPALGSALLALERGDTVTALKGLVGVAGTLQPAHGGAAMHLLAGRLARQQGDLPMAETLLKAADNPEAPASAAEAELELARLMIGASRTAEATAMLEHLILTFPSSAAVPEARRTLDEARGVVPS